MRNSIFCSLLLLGLFSCTGGSRYSEGKEAYARLEKEGLSILDYEYINDTLGLNILDFRAVRFEDAECRFDIYLVTQYPEKYGKNHRFFIHAYPENTTEADGGFTPLGTNQIRMEEGLLVYSRTFATHHAFYRKLRYGLIDGAGERLFTLKLDSVQLY